MDKKTKNLLVGLLALGFIGFLGLNMLPSLISFAGNIVSTIFSVAIIAALGFGAYTIFLKK